MLHFSSETVGDGVLGIGEGGGGGLRSFAGGGGDFFLCGGGGGDLRRRLDGGGRRLEEVAFNARECEAESFSSAMPLDASCKVN